MSDKPAPKPEGGKRIAVISPDGRFGTIDEKHAAAVVRSGGRVLSKQEVAQRDVDARYDALPMSAKALGAVNTVAGAVNPLTLGANTGAPSELQAYSGGVRDGLSGGLADAGIRKVVDAVGGKAAGDKYALQVEQERTAAPIATGIGEGVGLVAGSVLGEAGAARALPTSGAAALGSAAEKLVGGQVAKLAGKGVAGRALTTAAEMGTRGAIEGGIYSGTKYAGEEWLQDKEAATDKLFAAVGTGALWGGVGGALLGGGGSLAASGLRGAGSAVRGGLARAMSRGERGATELAEAAPVMGKEVRLDSAALDAGIGERVAAESPFTFGAEKRPVQLRPDVGQRGALAAEEPFSLARTMGIDPDAGLRAPINPGAGPIELPAFNRGSRRAALDAALRGEESPLGASLGEGVFDFERGIAASKKDPLRHGFDVSFDPEAGIARRGAGGKFQGDVAATDALKLSSAAKVERDVLLREGIDAASAGTAKSPIRIPKPDAIPSTPTSLINDLGSADGLKGLAYDRAFGSLGGGFGLQSTEFTKRAQRYLSNGVRDVGEWMMRKGIINAKAGALDIAKAGTPEKMLPSIIAANEATGVRIGQITDASGGRIKSAAVMQAIDDIAQEYEKSAATRPIGRSIRNFGNELLDSLGVTKGAESHAVQDVIRERKAIDLMVFENAALDPSITVQVKRQLRGRLEGLVIDSLDEASGKLTGELAKEYKALKKDYLAGMIAQEAAEDSAARAAKAGFFGLKDIMAGGGSLIKTAGSKLLRERGDAVAAAMLFQQSERGTLVSLVQKMDGQIDRASKGLLQAPAKGLLKSADQMPATKLLANAAVKRVAEFNADPEAFVEKATRQVESISAHEPEIAQGIVQRQVQTMAFLSEKMPVTPDPDPLDPHPAPKMTPNEAAEFGRYAWYAEKPQRFFAEVARGKLTYEGAETAQRLMPRAFEELQMRTMEALATQMARGNKLPYRQRQILGVLMDVATTPSQRPDHAAFLQKNLEPIQDPAPKGGGGGGGKSLAGPKLSALDRLETGGVGHKS